MKKIVLWTIEEERVLLQCVKNHKKKQDAFQQASSLLTNRTKRSCQDRWDKLKNTKTEIGNGNEILKAENFSQADFLQMYNEMAEMLDHYEQENLTLTKENEFLRDSSEIMLNDLDQSIVEKGLLASRLEIVEAEKRDLKNKLEKLRQDNNRILLTLKKSNSSIAAKEFPYHESKSVFRMDVNGNLERV